MPTNHGFHYCIMLQVQQKIPSNSNHGKYIYIYIYIYMCVCVCVCVCVMCVCFITEQEFIWICN